jgi:hypothetical protein
LPASPLWNQATEWYRQAFQRVDGELRIGINLASPFLAVGLPPPHLLYEAAIGAGPEWTRYAVLAGIVDDLLPLLEKFGVATREDVGIETLADRLREEVVRGGGAARLPPLVSA